LDFEHLLCPLIICGNSLGIQRANRLDVADWRFLFSLDGLWLDLQLRGHGLSCRLNINNFNVNLLIFRYRSGLRLSLLQLCFGLLFKI
jgi:hypothetical protein